MRGTTSETARSGEFDRPCRLPARRSVLFADDRALLAAAGLAVAAPAAAKHRSDARFATFNASLNRGAAGDLVADLSNPGADTVRVRQARNVAEVIQRAAPDVVLVNEFDFYENGQAARLFRDNFLAVSQNGAPAARYPYFFVAPSNTGIASGFDLNNMNGVVTTPGAFGYGDDSFGFGAFPGQFGMVVYSKHPIDYRKARTFQHFLWDDMPGARMPRAFYSPEEQAILRLSSKSHWDIPIRIGRKTVHFLTSHPTPPVFDGPEDRNGTRNADEIRFWADYVTPGRGRYIYDDEGRRGGLKHDALFVIAGDQNSDPLDGDSIPGAIQQLLDNPRINDGNAPSSSGAVEADVAAGRRERHAPQRPAVRHGGLQRHGAGQPARGLRAAEPQDRHRGLGGVLAAAAGSAVPARPACSTASTGARRRLPDVRPPARLGRRRPPARRALGLGLGLRRLIGPAAGGGATRRRPPRRRRPRTRRPRSRGRAGRRPGCRRRA